MWRATRDDLAPHRPAWAHDLPAPDDGESFEAYCRRIEIPDWVIEWLLEDLTEVTMVLANLRLACYLLSARREV